MPKKDYRLTFFIPTDTRQIDSRNNELAGIYQYFDDAC
ncbi:hypothetical protein VQ7734_02206 [Vibrio quintilis]|uniref:Uncharacterized protein n=1 Tax=Vibrio quintilis TaxID=1117707 RepID=A0A1M7YUS6_9VIBR|nr:hypothetical protein VQ7734_02206 [Vibrio quintilis]